MNTFVTLLAFASAALAAPANVHNSLKLKRADIPATAGRYIVKLKATADKTASIESIKTPSILSDESSTSSVVYDDWSLINAYVADLSPSALDALLADDAVEYIEEDGLASIFFDVEKVDIEPRAAAPVAEMNYFNKRETGLGVDIYSVDTGVYINHTAFTGRATWGATFGGYASVDGNGHGTHTMGTAAGVGYGPATNASIIAVRVFSDAGRGAWSDVIAGINWAAAAANATGKPSLINLSLGGGSTTSVDDAVTAALGLGIHVVVAAGNNNVDAADTTPAHVEAAYTIGAIDSSNKKASFSNYGAVVDVWYLGVSVLSSYIGSPNATAVLSGTSMATPGVVGLLATEIEKYGNQSPADLQAALKANALAVVTGAPSGTTNLKATAW